MNISNFYTLAGTMDEICAILVDDDPVCLEQLRVLLKDHHNITVQSTHTGPADALQEMGEKQPHLVFLDIEMPGITGLELAEEIRKLNPEITLIFVTSYNKYAIQAIKQAAYDYILKPIDPDELAETLARYNQEQETKHNLLHRLKSKYPLTSRELEILNFIRQGLTSEEIASRLTISRLTVNTHRQNILKKTGCVNFNEVLGR